MPTPPDARIITISGRASRTVLDLVDPRLAAMGSNTRWWCYVKEGYPDLAVGDTFTHLFYVSRENLVVPLRPVVFTVLAVQHDCGNFYDLDFYRENPQFKTLWGWRPLCLIERVRGNAPAYSCNESDRWQIGSSEFMLGTDAAFDAATAQEPAPTFETVTAYIELLERWSNGCNHVSTFHLQPLPTPQGPYPHLHDPGWKWSLEETSPAAWPTEFRAAAYDPFNITNVQADKLLTMLHAWWGAWPERTWLLHVDPTGGGFYDICYIDYVLQVAGACYCLHLSFSD